MLLAVAGRWVVEVRVGECGRASDKGKVRREDSMPRKAVRRNMTYSQTGLLLV